VRIKINDEVQEEIWVPFVEKELVFFSFFSFFCQVFFPLNKLGVLSIQAVASQAQGRVCYLDHL
jgi:hypothetical protein